MYKTVSILITLLFTYTCGTFAQQTLIASSGGIYSTTNLTMAWSLGEIATETLDSGNLILTQGMQQPTKNVTGINQNNAEMPELNVYPNPVKEMLFIDAKKILPGKFEVRITDAQGKLVDTKKIDALPAKFETGQIEPGLYLFNLIKNNQIIFTTYIVKN